MMGKRRKCSPAFRKAGEYNFLLGRLSGARATLNQLSSRSELSVTQRNESIKLARRVKALLDSIELQKSKIEREVGQ